VTKAKSTSRTCRLLLPSACKQTHG
jgi:hypothetical protein